MTNNVLEFKVKSRTRGHKKTTSIVSNHELFQDVREDVLGEWQAAAYRDKLNAYIDSKLPSTVKMKSNTNYLSNLSSLAMIEQKLDMKVAMFYPGCTIANQAGWMAAFHKSKEVFTTPEMASEGYARAINIVTFISFEKHLKTLGRK